MTTTTAVDTHIDRTALKRKVADGTIKLPDLWKALAVPAPSEVVAQAPLAAVITEKQTAALSHLPEVFGKVIPTEVRSLTEDEVATLMDERLTLDEIAALAEDRKKEIRTTVLNHIDEEIDDDDAPRDKEGHVLTAAKIPAPEFGKVFSWELRNNGGTLNTSALLDLVEAGTIDRQIYLDMTTQVRVVDENKVMLQLKKHPELIDALGDAVTETSQTGSFYVRKQK
jgi:hypothetical protein